MLYSLLGKIKGADTSRICLGAFCLQKLQYIQKINFYLDTQNGNIYMMF